SSDGPRSSAFPLDVAAEAGLLVRRYGCTGQQRIARCAEILAGRCAPARPAVGELAAIDELALPVEQVQVRRTRSVVRLGDALCRIEQIRKRVTGAARFLRHAFRPVLWIG